MQDGHEWGEYPTALALEVVRRSVRSVFAIGTAYGSGFGEAGDRNGRRTQESRKKTHYTSAVLAVPMHRKKSKTGATTSANGFTCQLRFDEAEHQRVQEVLVTVVR